MKQNNNEQIVFEIFEEVATESIAEARNAFKLRNYSAPPQHKIVNGTR